MHKFTLLEYLKLQFLDILMILKFCTITDYSKKALNQIIKLRHIVAISLETQNIS